VLGLDHPVASLTVTEEGIDPEAPAPLTKRATRASPFPDGAAKHWLISSVIWLTVVDLFGLVLATEFVSPEAFGGISWLSFSRVRPSHVNGVILAWLTMMYFGALFYMLPRLVGTKGMWSERLGIWCAWAWNIMFTLGIIALLTGHSQGREYGELIWPLDIALLVIWCANITFQAHAHQIPSRSLHIPFVPTRRGSM
jgi:cbb3-type cytochrome oxidase subunit 1